MSNLFVKKNLDTILQQAADHQDELKRTLTPFSLIMMGIGAVIGAGLFIRTAAATADYAGPSVTLGFILAGIGCSFAGLCYAEFASRIPIAGSAFTYAYVTFGELAGWTIGWNLVLEYALGSATVAIGWSQYLNKLLGYLHINGHSLVIPPEWSHSPFDVFVDTAGHIHHGIINIPAIFIVGLMSFILIRGIHGSALINNIIVSMKVVIVILFIVFGWQFINPANQTPYIPPPSIYVDSSGVSHTFGGLSGILGAAGVVFFAFIGFDAVSTVSQETINPKRSMPIGILGSLIICTALYVLFSYVLTGIANTEDFRTVGQEASITYAIQTYMPGYEWLAKLITIAIIIGLSSVLLVMLLGQSRIFYSMSRDGLLPKWFSDVHSQYRTPYKSNIFFAIAVGLTAGLVPADLVGDMTSIGTLFAFSLVCGGVIVLRRNHAIDTPGHFETPWFPFVPIMGIVVCGIMIYGLGFMNWMRLLIWLLLGFVVYFGYSRMHSHLGSKNDFK